VTGLFHLEIMIINEGTLEYGDYYIHKSNSYQWAFDTKVQGTYYGFLNNASGEIWTGDRSYTVNSRTVFSFPARADRRVWIECSFPSDLMLIFCPNFSGQTVLGVPLEQDGRLQYIDGCTDSLLVYAPRLGDPCLNHLHFPVGIDQTFHTHPSIRMGYVARGNGVASFPDGDHNLNTGDIFLLPVDTLHRFRTPNESMDIIAFHPETDTGPTDEDHPMLNRTIIAK
jgi:quercetin dioxygenase-like cupin family protein